eukprot:Skav221387  [mRNA]  locus=scaffold4031:24080:24406:+ [translate_table: standard]
MSSPPVSCDGKVSEREKCDKHPWQMPFGAFRNDESTPTVCGCEPSTVSVLGKPQDEASLRMALQELADHDQYLRSVIIGQINQCLGYASVIYGDNEQIDSTQPPVKNG